MPYVPPLVMAAAGAVAPPAPSPDEPGVNVWRNKRGGVVATGMTCDGVHWMHWPFLAAYRSHPATRRLRPSRPLTHRSTFSRTRIAEASFRWPSGARVRSASCQRLALSRRRRRLLRRLGNRQVDHRVRLSQRGFAQWGDDSLLFEPSARPFVSRRLPFDIRLRPKSSAFFDANPPRDTDDGLMLPESAPVAALCLLSRGERPVTSPIAVRRLDPVQAFSWLIAHAIASIRTRNPASGDVEALSRSDGRRTSL
jgi:hypothetical protein